MGGLGKSRCFQRSEVEFEEIGGLKMISFIKKEQISDEENNSYRPTAIEATTQQLPYAQLGSRNFEILIYRLFEKKVPNVYKNVPNVKVELMEEIADQGRDICFIVNGIIDGVVQCKDWKEKISKNKLISEIVKMLLFMINEGVEIFPKYYWIVIPAGISSLAKKLIRSFKDNIVNEDLEECFKHLKDEYESFSCLTYNDISETLSVAIKNLSVFEIDAVSLDEMIFSEPNILKMHFNLLSIIDCNSTKKLLDQSLEEHGLPLLTDVDLKILQDNIKKIPSDARLHLMGVDILGVKREIFNIKDEKFLELYKQLLRAWNLLIQLIMERISNEVHTNIFEKITTPLLMKGKVHPNSISFCAPYITKCVLQIFLELSQPNFLSENRSQNEKFKKIEEEVGYEVLDCAKKAFNGDFSMLKGNRQLKEFKIDMMKNKLLSGFNSIDEIEQKFYNDLSLLKPVCDDIINSLLEKYSFPKTIVVHDLSIWNSHEYSEQMTETLKSLDKNK